MDLMAEASSLDIEDSSERQTPPGPPEEPRAAETQRLVPRSGSQKRLGKGRRVCVSVASVTAVTEDVAIRQRVSELPKTMILHGLIVAGDSKTGWAVKLDIMGPNPPNTVTVSAKGKKVSPESSTDTEAANGRDDDDGLLHGNLDTTSTTQPFPDMSAEAIRKATECQVKWGNGDNEFIKWTIHADDDRPSLGGTPTAHESMPVLAEINWDEPLHTTFFKHVMPDVTGHARKLDEWASDPKCGWYRTYMDHRLKFEQDGLDPDKLVKQMYLLIIAGTTEIESGVQGLWRRGRSNGRRMYPDFGRYADQKTFNVFRQGAIFCYVGKEQWFQDTYSWALFEGVLENLKGRRSDLFVKLFAVLFDESMLGWRPKTTKAGGLPNIMFEPRKPKSIGTMLRNCAEVHSGVLVNHQVVKDPMLMHQLQLFDQPSSLPDGAKINDTTAECLRQARAALGDKPDGDGPYPLRFVGGDAWFGGVMSCVELKKRLAVDSTFIIKDHARMFPKEHLGLVLEARHGGSGESGRRGNWVVMSTEVAGVKLLAVAYAWSTRGVSYMISTIGSTNAGKDPYVSFFEDDYGMVATVEIPRPELCSYLYNMLPLIDEHNRQRQYFLDVAGKWPTKDPWFRLLGEIIGICVVDFFKLVRFKFPERYENFSVVKFADLLCAGLYERDLEMRGPAPAEAAALVSVSKDDRKRKRSIDKGDNRGGFHYQKACWSCRGHYRAYIMTTGACPYCGVPLCKLDRSKQDPNRTMTCYAEHLTDRDQGTKCREGGMSRFMPTDASILARRAPKPPWQS